MKKHREIILDTNFLYRVFKKNGSKIRGVIAKISGKCQRN